MSAATTSPTAPTDPATPPAAPTTPTALGRVLSVLRKLIDLGKQVAATVQQRATAPDFWFFAKPFGTADLAIILTRITNALRLAAALEARLCQRAERGQDLAEMPIPMPSARNPRPERQIAPPDTQTEPQSADHPQDPRLARLLTEAEIAAEIRRRPIGAIIVDICLDLGITAGQLDRAFWDELAHSIVAYGGSLAHYFISMNKRVFSLTDEELASPTAPWANPPPRSPALSTHPP